MNMNTYRNGFRDHPNGLRDPESLLPLMAEGPLTSVQSGESDDGVSSADTEAHRTMEEETRASLLCTEVSPETIKIHSE